LHSAALDYSSFMVGSEILENLVKKY
jgi:hypothetical protein